MNITVHISSLNLSHSINHFNFNIRVSSKWNSLLVSWVVSFSYIHILNKYRNCSSATILSERIEEHWIWNAFWIRNWLSQIEIISACYNTTFLISLLSLIQLISRDCRLNDRNGFDNIPNGTYNYLSSLPKVRNPARYTK